MFSTRVVARKLRDHLRVPFYGLIDLNTHGFLILCAFKFGPKYRTFDNLNPSIHDLRWICVFPHDAANIVSRPLSQRENKILQNVRNADFGKHLNRTMVDPMMIFRYKVDIDVVLQNQTIGEYLNGKIPQMEET